MYLEKDQYINYQLKLPPGGESELLTVKISPEVGFLSVILIKD